MELGSRITERIKAIDFSGSIRPGKLLKRVEQLVEEEILHAASMGALPPKEAIKAAVSVALHALIKNPALEAVVESVVDWIIDALYARLQKTPPTPPAH